MTTFCLQLDSSREPGFEELNAAELFFKVNVINSNTSLTQQLLAHLNAATYKIKIHFVFVLCHCSGHALIGVHIFLKSKN